MEEQFDKNKITALITVSLAVLFGLVIIFNFLQKRVQPKPIPAPTPTHYPTPTSIELIYTSPPPRKLTPPQTIRNVPTLTPDKGLGVDVESEAVKASTQEIEKLSYYLPFTFDYKLSTNLTVSVVIPAKDLQDNPWTLMVQIFGIDYNVPPENQQMKTSFLEAVNAVFEWMKSVGADPQKIIIKWGDKAFIQNQAEAWLSSQ